MSIYDYLQLQPVDPQDDGTVSDLDQSLQDEVIDLSQDEDGEVLNQEWEEILQDFKNDPDPLNFSDK